MTIEKPTLSEIQSRLITDLIQTVNTGVSDTTKHIDPNLRNSLIRGLLNALAGGISDNFDAIQTLQEDLFPYSTEDEDIILDWAATFGVTQKVATTASGLVTFTGTAGTTIPNGTAIQTTTGLEYTTQIDSTIASNTVNITSLSRAGYVVTAVTSSDHNLASGVEVTISGATETNYNVTAIITVTDTNAFSYEITTTPTTPATGSPQVTFVTASTTIESSDVGLDYNAIEGTELNLISPISGLDTAAYVQYTELSGGTNIETIEELRTRINARTAAMAAPFTVAGLPSFIRENNTGVTRVWVEAATPSAGYTTIYFTRDNDTNILPSSAEAAAVKTSITNEETGVLPANMSESALTVSSPAAVSVDFTFSALSPNTTDMQTTITNSLIDYFKNNTNVSSNITLDDIKRIISSSFDSSGNIPTYTLTTPSSDVLIGSGELGVLGTITYP
jgi:hypothetical protein